MWPLQEHAQQGYGTLQVLLAPLTTLHRISHGGAVIAGGAWAVLPAILAGCCTLAETPESSASGGVIKTGDCHPAPICEPLAALLL